jgi:phenylacetic acid degradation operon negative regulatory protein
LRKRLLWLGFGALHQGTWISPRDLRPEVEKVASSLNLHPYVEFFAAEHRGFSSDKEIVARCWDLQRLNDYYAGFLARFAPLFQDHQGRFMTGNGPSAQDCFVQRFMLVHEYRSSPYVDPNLPTSLLPDDWLADRATQLFRHYHDLLSEGAEAFVDTVLAEAP